MSRFSLLVFLIWLANCDNISYSAKTREISSVVSTVGQIPCSAEPFYDVAMILWFKDSSGTPIYSYDARSEKEEPKHMTLKDDWGLRLYFRVWPSSKRPPALIIRDLQIQDAGLYRCRVDFRNSPTTNAITVLKVVQPPTHLEIRDTSQSRPISDQQIKARDMGEQLLSLSDITYMGPYIEGQNVTVICSAYGGQPIPEVIWYWNGRMVDNTYDLVGNNYATNELSITLLGRNHSHDLYTCQASNNNETKPISHRVNFDVYLTVKHIEVEIPDQMTAGLQYNLVCRAAGAYPTVKMEFWRIQKRIGPKYQIKSDADNVTFFVLPFKPEISDDETIITCRAENPWISQHFMETSRKLHVFYPPVVVLRFGSNKARNLSEGESLLMECHVKANPPIHSTMWFHEVKAAFSRMYSYTGQQILDDPVGGVRVNGMTLLIRHLSHFSIGNYWCQSANDAGKASSNTMEVILNIAPKCANPETIRVSLSRGNAHHLPCNILAWPPDLNFYWTLNRSSEILPIPSSGQTVKKGGKGLGGDAGFFWNMKGSENLSGVKPGLLVGLTESDTDAVRGRGRRKDVVVNSEAVRHQAVLLYRVKSDEDYGLVACWARNSYGKQIRPCLFQITTLEELNGGAVEGEPPERNLTQLNEEDSSTEVENGTFLSKLHETLGGIILMGLLIFITTTSLGVCMWLFFRKRQRAKMSKVPSPSIRPTSPDMGSSDCTCTSGSTFIGLVQSSTSTLNSPKALLRHEGLGWRRAPEDNETIQSLVQVQVQVQVEQVRKSPALSASNKSDQVFL